MSASDGESRVCGGPSMEPLVVRNKLCIKIVGSGGTVPVPWPLYLVRRCNGTARLRSLEAKIVLTPSGSLGKEAARGGSAGAAPTEPKP
jgi:hypothetical protein